MAREIGTAKAAGDRGPRPAAGFEVTAEAFDVGATHAEQVQAVLLGPGAELTQVQVYVLRISPR